MIQFIVLQNRQGKTRLSKYYRSYTDEEKTKIEGEIHRIVTIRDPKFTNFVEVHTAAQPRAPSLAAGDRTPGAFAQLVGCAYVCAGKARAYADRRPNPARSSSSTSSSTDDTPASSLPFVWCVPLLFAPPPPAPPAAVGGLRRSV